MLTDEIICLDNVCLSKREENRTIGKNTYYSTSASDKKLSIWRILGATETTVSVIFITPGIRYTLNGRGKESFLFISTIESLFSSSSGGI